MVSTLGAERNTDFGLSSNPSGQKSGAHQIKGRVRPHCKELSLIV